MVTEIEKEERYIPLWYDLMFKKVFGDEVDKRPLKYLLKLILDIEPKEIRILNNEILGDSFSNKKTTVDIIVELEDGKKIGIEMNRTMSQEIIDRNLIYMFRIMANALAKGKHYDELDKHIQINFDMEGEHREPIESYKMISTKHLNNLLTDKIEIIRIDVPYFTRKCYNLDNNKLSAKEKIIGLIGIEDKKEALNVIGKDDIMGEIVNKVRGFSKEDVVAASYDYDFHVKECARIAAKREAQEMLEEKFEQGWKEGVEQGIEQGILQIAKRMLEEKMDISIISKVTGLSEEDIQNIGNE